MVNLHFDSQTNEFKAATTHSIIEVIISSLDADTVLSQFLHMRKPATSGVKRWQPGRCTFRKALRKQEVTFKFKTYAVLLKSHVYDKSLIRAVI